MAITPKMARVGANLTQIEIAEKLGVHPQTYAAFEKHPDKMSVGMAKRFSDIVGIDMDELDFSTHNSN